MNVPRMYAGKARHDVGWNDGNQSGCVERLQRPALLYLRRSSMYGLGFIAANATQQEAWWLERLLEATRYLAAVVVG